MTFQESIKVCFSKYADFSGRASRSEYWWFFLFVIVVGAVISMLSDKLAVVFYIGTLMPSLSAATRRLHDTERNGWWQLVAFIPLVGVIILLVFLTQKSGPGAGGSGTAA